MKFPNFSSSFLNSSKNLKNPFADPLGFLENPWFELITVCFTFSGSKDESLRVNVLIRSFLGSILSRIQVYELAVGKDQKLRSNNFLNKFSL